MLEIIDDEHKSHLPSIYVVGIGGGGNNAINRMVEAGLSNVNFIAVNTDYDVLESSKADVIVQIGQKTTNGYGAGTDPVIGEAAAEESSEEIMNSLSGADMVILTCGLGGGTGTGAIPLIAKLCHDANILTVAVVTLPFVFEGTPRMKIALQGLEKLQKEIDTLLVIPNNKLLEISEKQFYLDEAFTMADNVLKYTIQGITNIIYNKGTVNLDFNDFNKLLRNKGLAHLGIGIAQEGGSVIDAVKQAINSPLLETTINSATDVMLNTSGRINLMELNEAVNYIHSLTGPDTNVVWGTVTDKETLQNNSIVVTLIATGIEINKKPLPPKLPAPKVTVEKSTFTLQSSLDLLSLQIPSFLKEYKESRKG